MARHLVQRDDAREALAAPLGNLREARACAVRALAHEQRVADEQHPVLQRGRRRQPRVRGLRAEVEHRERRGARGRDVGEVALRVDEQVRARRDPHCAAPPAQCVLEDDPGNLPPLADARPVPHEEPAPRAAGAREAALVLRARRGNRLELNVR